MSYDIYIGNAVEDEHFGTRVDHHTAPDAPAFPFDGMTGNGNSRHPGYSQWGNFCDEAGLSALFFDPTRGLMRDHPGTVPLTRYHLDTVRAARQEWEMAHPNAVPGWDYHGSRYHAQSVADDGVRGRDGILARLIWLEFWMAWALDNCERPALFNA